MQLARLDRRAVGGAEAREDVGGDREAERGVAEELERLVARRAGAARAAGADA
jgi:hypothetical protein